MGRKSPGGLSLARDECLRRAAEIQALFQSGRRDERRSFVALWRPRDGSRRVGFTVGRRVGGAAKRNRARRRIREAYRRQQHALPQGIEVVFIGRPSALTNTFPQILEDMNQFLVAMTQRGAQMRSGVAPE